LTPVSGDPALARDLHAESVGVAARSPSFLALIAQAVASMPPSLGPFGGLRTVAGRIDLKLGALLPLVGLARTLALRIDSLERSTPARVLAAAAADRIAESDARVLIDVHANLLELILRQQLLDLADGVRPSTRVSIRRLGREQVRGLARELRRLEEMLDGLQRTISG
jgi:signal-transduction protein with cAMP-binding, CBS, and nucleotidyltransferase domain